MSRRVLVLLAACSLVPASLAGCGDDGEPVASAPSGTPSVATPPPAAPVAPGSRVPAPLRVPDDVPQRSDGRPTDEVSGRVIRKWLGALSGGDIERAARFFASPAKVQNGTPVLVLRSADDREAFNDAFPCGARATRLERGPGGYTIVDFVLTERTGGDCQGGAGGEARSAIRVRDGHITDWYRLDPLVPATPPPAGPPPGTPSLGGGSIA